MKFILTVTLTLLSLAILAESRLALVCSSDSANGVADLAIVELGKTPGIIVLDRATISAQLEEHKLSLAGYATAETAVKAGKLLKADVLAILESDEKTHSVFGLTVFDTQTGIRYRDSAVPKGASDAQAKFVTDNISSALRKRNAFLSKSLTAVSIRSIRNVNMPRKEDGIYQAKVRAVERLLINAPDIVVLERRLLDKLNDERLLPGRDMVKSLLPSAYLLDIAFEKNPNDNTIDCSVINTASGTVIAKQTFQPKANGTIPLSIANRIIRSVGSKSIIDQSLSTKSEAARFIRESQLREKHKQLTLAREAAEAAYALDPSSHNLTHLSECLFREAEFILGKYQHTGAIEIVTIPEKLTRSLNLANRGLDLLEMTATDKTPFDPFHFGAYWLAKYMEKPLKTIRGHNNETREQLAELQHRSGRLLRKSYMSYYGDRKKRPKQYFEVVDQYLNGMIGMASVNADEYADEMARALTHACTEMAEGDGKHGLDILARISDKSVQRPNLPFKLTKTQHSKIYDALRILTTSANAEVKRHGELCLLYWDGKKDNTTLEQQALALDKRLAVIKSSLKTEPSHIEANWRHFNDILAACNSVTHNVLEFPRAIDRAIDLARLMVDYRQIDISILEDTCQTLVACGSREQVQAYLPVLTLALNLINTLPENRIKKKGYGNDVGMQNLRSWRFSMAAQHKIDLETPTPWVAEKLLLQVRDMNETRRFVSPILSGNTLYLAELSVDAKTGSSQVQLITINIGTGKVHKGGTYPLSWDTMAHTAEEVTSSFLGKDTFWVGTRESGVVGLPLSGNALVKVTTADGLPSNYVRGVGELNGHLYLGLGTPAKEGFFVKFALETKKAELLASSLRPQKISPFDDAGKPFRISSFLHDTKRNRLLFCASAAKKTTGLWAIDGETETISQVVCLRSHGEIMHFSNPDTLLIHDSYLSIAVDLTDNELELLVTMDGTPEPMVPGGKKQKPKYPGTRIFAPSIPQGYYFWSSFSWARTNQKGKMETLPHPKCSITALDYSPREMLCLCKDRQSLICVDQFQVICLRLAKPNEGRQ